MPLVIVQHMPEGFTRSLAARLNRAGPVGVREAGEFCALQAGMAAMSPAGVHLTVGQEAVHHSRQPPVLGLRPRADITLASAARRHGTGTLAIVLTGMGQDALSGCREVVRRGGTVWAQDADSALVDGMPRAVRDSGLAARTGTPAEFATALLEMPTAPSRRAE